MRRDVPADGYSLTKGRKPHTGSNKLHVQFRNGWTDPHEYVADDLRWTDTGHAWGVVAVRRA